MPVNVSKIDDLRRAKVSLLHCSRFEGPAERFVSRMGPTAYDQFNVILGGCYQAVTADGQVIRAEAGDVVYLPTHLVRTEESDPQAPLVCHKVLFYWHDAPADLPLHCRDPRGRMGQLAEWLHQDRNLIGPAARVLRHGLLVALVGEYRRQHDEAEPDPLVRKVRTHLQARLGEPLQLEDLARLVHLDKFHFSRTYKTHTGMSPMADLRRLRLERARDLLLTTDLDCGTIARTVGLASAQHLSRWFRRTFDVTPRQLRG